MIESPSGLKQISGRARVIALYLPQFHPIPENDIWWGKGFTEWTNVGKAKPLYKGHYQPRVPADLGYYDLRIPEIRKEQAELARQSGVEGFCYWHYWFGDGKRLLERPFNEVLRSGEPDFPFCLAWANETWRGFNHGITNRNVLIEQTYPGVDDVRHHFLAVLPALKDKRYIKIDNKPIFVVYKPVEFQEASGFIEIWQKLAKENGLEGIFFIGCTSVSNEISHLKSIGFDAILFNRIFNYVNSKMSLIHRIMLKARKFVTGMPRVYQYESLINHFTGIEDEIEYVFPSIYPNWDHTPRSGKQGVVFQNSTPELFARHASMVFSKIANKRDEMKIVFLKSWNEWAEGNYIEPDIKFGHRYLNALRDSLTRNYY